MTNLSQNKIYNIADSPLYEITEVIEFNDNNYSDVI
jgi:hypothetical protein